LRCVIVSEKLRTVSVASTVSTVIAVREDRESDHRRRGGAASKAVFKTGPQLGVKQLEHGNRHDPREQGNHFVDKAANEADGAAAKQ